MSPCCGFAAAAVQVDMCTLQCVKNICYVVADGGSDGVPGAQCPPEPSGTGCTYTCRVNLQNTACFYRRALWVIGCWWAACMFVH
jgi:hypothetical protein